MPVASTINFDLVTLETLDPATGATLFSQTWNPAGGTPPLQRNYIGERKRIKLDFSTPSMETVDGTDLRFIPALFVNDGVTSGYGFSGPAQYRWNVQSSWTSGTEYDGLLDSTLGTPQNNRQRNYDCTFERIDAQTFSIRLEFYMTADEEGFLVSAIFNHDRFLKCQQSAASELTEVGTNTYTHVKRAMGIFLSSRSTTDGTFVKIEKYVQFNSGFYGKKALGAAGWFSNPIFTLVDPSNNPATNFLFSQDTVIRFRVNAPFVGTVRVWFYLIRTDTTNNGVRFLDNYEVSVAEIVTTGGTAQIGNAFYAPAVGPTLLSGTQYDCSITVDNDTLVQSAKYRVVAVCMLSGENHVTTFISDEYSMTGVVSWNGEGFAHRFNFLDYHSSFPEGKLKCTVEERIRARLTLSYFPTQFSDDILSRLGLTVPNDIRRYLTRIRATIFERRTDEAGIAYAVYRDDIYADVFIDRVSGTYPANGGLTFSGGLDAAEITFDFRTRYESWMPNIATYFDSTLQPLPLSTQFWPGKNLTIRITLELYYHDYGTPFTDRLIFDNNLEVRDYVTEDFFNIDSERAICVGPDTCYEAELDLGGDEDNYKLLTTVEPMNGNSSTVAENEVYFPGVLPQLTTPRIASQDENFVSGVANFCVDTSELAKMNLTNFKIVAIAKKSAEALDEARVTNDEEARVTNDDETRYTNG